MQKIKRKAIIGLIVFICAFSAACSNSIMEKWWHEDSPSRSTPTAAPRPPDVSGVNFGVVFLDGKGGTPQPQPFRVLWDNKVPRVRVIEPPNPTFGFAGWFDENGNKWDMDTRTVKPEDDVNGDGIITLTARWAQEYVTVKFVTNYDQIFGLDTNKYPKNQQGNEIKVADQKIVPGNKLVEPPVIPTDGIYGLIGWFTQNGSAITNPAELSLINVNSRWDFENNTVNDPVNTTVTLYARWSTFSRTVHLQINGGTRPNGQELTRVNFTVFTGLGGSAGGKVIDPGPLSRDGHTFAGWFTESGVEWNFSTSKINEVDLWDGGILRNDAFILHARWVPNIYYVTFDANGGTPVPLKQSVVHGEMISRPHDMEPPPPAPAEQAFSGWFTDLSNPATEWDFDKNIVTSSITLFAKWVPRNYTVRFYLGTGAGDSAGKIPQWNTPPGEPFLEQYYSDSNDRVIEPFMPALPGNDTTSWSFLGWYVCWDSDDSVPSTVNTANAGWRQGYLQTYGFHQGVGVNTDLLRTEGNVKVLNLYARWVPPVPDMVWVPKGSFVMGDSGVSGSPAAYHSYPIRRVTLDGFYISRYEVTEVNSPNGTIRGYGNVMGVNPSQFSKNTNRPVERVSWYDAIDYCMKLTELTFSPGNAVYSMSNRVTAPISGTGTPGIQSISSASVTATWNRIGYRLPTEAEWEYAARGGNDSPGNFAYAGGNDPNAVAWYNETVKSRPSGDQATQPVGSKQPNGLGIYDMSGNVSEWVWDLFDSYKSTNPNGNPLINPIGPASSPDGTRVRRGGSWSNAASNVRSVVRNSDNPGTAHWAIGFRVVRGAGVIW